jgi:hypothetical protein
MKGLNIYGKTSKDTNQIWDILDEEGYYVEFNDSYLFIPEEEENYDNLEYTLTELLDLKWQTLGLNYRIEGIF